MKMILRVVFQREWVGFVQRRSVAGAWWLVGGLLVDAGLLRRGLVVWSGMETYRRIV
jgi:hypothetical protein